jgi:hypothetical protein
MRTKLPVILCTAILHFIASIALGQNGVFDESFHKNVKDKFPYIRTAQNQLDIYNAKEWETFFEKVSSMQEGRPDQLHIFHIGGSHVQAGIFSNQIEKNIKQLFPQEWKGEKGFLFPYQLSGTNAPEGYKIKYSGKWEGCRSSVRSMDCFWGLSGINASTSTPYSSVYLRPEDQSRQNQPFCTVRIFCDLQNSTMMPEPYTPECPSHVVVDSIAGIIEWYFEEEQQDIELMWRPEVEEQDSGVFILQGFQFISDHPGVVMHPIGVNGASLHTWLKCKGFETHLKQFKPDLVLLAVGVNDANVPYAEFSTEKFEREYEAILDRFRQANPEVRFVFITNNDTFYKRKYANKNAIKVRESMYVMAEKHGAAVWNIFDIMGGLGSIQKWQLSGLAKKDKIHFSGAGYVLLGDLFAHALAQSINEYRDQKTALSE